MMSYILELRHRLMRVFVIFAVSLIASFYFSEPLFHYLIYPLQHQLPPGHTLIAIQLTSAVFTPLSIAFHMACLLTMPYLLWQLWQFIHPALYGHEKSWLRMPLFASLGLLFLGMAFAYWVILPFMFQFFISYLPPQVQMMPDMAYSIDFITRMLLLFGICFQVPLVCFLLVSTHIMAYQSLKRSRPYVIVGAFIVGMLLTPPDVVSQILLAVPLWMLFELGMMACAWHQRSSIKQALPNQSKSSST
ncbi:twin-arginine translocase subunit TatC [Legionella sp. W05-934-2]|jgi:sec-independent protein translocase protein TatC|uniref:twin-arginine translocase subunit TatC n=1 Tax=Legionella sp. W05-934-2 TaxID=1198649 RepID=UPI003463324E